MSFFKTKNEPENTSPVDLLRYYLSEIKKYHLQNKIQNYIIFIFGILAMIAGFFIIYFFIKIVISLPPERLSNQIIIGVFGIIGTILTNYVAIVLFRMYSSSNKVLDKFHSRLVDTNYVYIGNFLLTQIDQKNKDKKDEALVKMAINLTGPTDPYENEDLKTEDE